MAISDVGTTTSIAYCLKIKISSNIFIVHSYSKFLNENLDMKINFIRYLCEFLPNKTHKQIQYFFQHWDSRGIFLWKKSINLFKRVELEVLFFLYSIMIWNKKYAHYLMRKSNVNPEFGVVTSLFSYHIIMKFSYGIILWTLRLP